MISVKIAKVTVKVYNVYKIRNEELYAYWQIQNQNKALKNHDINVLSNITVVNNLNVA